MNAERALGTLARETAAADRAGVVLANESRGRVRGSGLTVSRTVTGRAAFAKLIAMPPPMVPAPITAARRIGSVGVSAAMPGILRASRSAKNTCTSASHCGLSRHSTNAARSRLQRLLLRRSVAAASMQSMTFQGASCPRAFGAIFCRKAANSSGLRFCRRSVRSLARGSGRCCAAARAANCERCRQDRVGQLIHAGQARAPAPPPATRRR